MRFLRLTLTLLGLASLAACACVDSGAGGGTAVAVPVAAPAQQAALPARAASSETLRLERAFTVRFDFDSAEIRASAMQILYEASQTAGRLKPVTVRIHGYTDRRGSRAYNQRLSERRAQAVATQLSKLGLKVAVVEVKGLGVGKASGTKSHPQDRKVEVLLEGSTEQDTPTTKVSADTPWHGLDAPASLPDRRGIAADRQTEYQTASLSAVVAAPTHPAAEVHAGWVAERFKAPVLKTGEGASSPWVRIPPHPPGSPGETRAA